MSGAASPVRRIQPARANPGGGQSRDYGNSPRRYGGSAALDPHSASPQGNGKADDWPLQSHLELGALPTAPGCARLHARQVLWEWGLGSLAETVELLVSEIVTNAVQAARELVAGRFGGQWLAEIPTVRVWLSSDRAAVLIQVWDADHRMPQRQDTGPEAESGRGLLLVEALSTEWGSYVPNGWRGKVVWASVNGTRHERERGANG
jgi:hypothetical protein